MVQYNYLIQYLMKPEHKATCAEPWTRLVQQGRGVFYLERGREPRWIDSNNVPTRVIIIFHVRSAVLYGSVHADRNMMNFGGRERGDTASRPRLTTSTPLSNTHPNPPTPPTRTVIVYVHTYCTDNKSLSSSSASSLFQAADSFQYYSLGTA